MTSTWMSWTAVLIPVRLVDHLCVIAHALKGCAYHRNGRIFDSKACISQAPPLTDNGQTVRMIVDFTAQTLTFIANGQPCPPIDMAKSDIGGGQSLYIATSCYGSKGGTVRLSMT